MTQENTKGKNFMKYIPVIGLEIHVQLLTKSKMFCSCQNKFGMEPNSLICPVCLGLPGSLPVLNKKALEYTIKTGFAVGCSIAEVSKMDRKNYFYPDLPKAYQISQYDQPVCGKGFIDITVNGVGKRIGITRIHMEEDAGKLIHEETGDKSLVDYNRVGVPLMEIVSEPDMRTPEEAHEYLKEIKAILEYLEVSDCNMQEGSLRCDANVSIMPEGAEKFGTKAEIKNMNSFKGVQKAVEYEIKRQIELVEKGEKVVQETRLWDAVREVTVSMRSKEEAHDYRYFPEPDIMTIYLRDEAFKKSIKDSLPELPKEKLKRFMEQHGLPAYDAGVLTAEKELAKYFEEAVNLYNNPKAISNWIMGDLLKELNNAGLSITNNKLSVQDLVSLIKAVEDGVVNRQTGKTVFEEMFRTGKKPDAIIEEKGLKQMNDASEFESIINEIIEKNPKALEEYKQGKEKAVGFFVGQVMYKTKGKANPKIVNQLVLDMLKKR